MSDEKYILSELIDDLTDLDSRLIYADWLEEQGDPRGEFTRVQCELQSSHDRVHKRELKKRQDELLAAHFGTWSQPITRLGIKPHNLVFRFGAIDSISVSGPEFVKKQHEIFEAAPLLRSIEFHNIVSKMSASPFLNRLVQILLVNESPEKIRSLLTCTTWSSLRAINLNYTFLETGLKNITSIDQKHLPKLIALDVERCGLSGHSVKQLSEWKAAKALRWLNLACNQLGDQAVPTLLNTPNWRDIGNIRLMGCGLNQDDIVILGERYGKALDLYRIYARFQN